MSAASRLSLFLVLVSTATACGVEDVLPIPDYSDGGGGGDTGGSDGSSGGDANSVGHGCDLSLVGTCSTASAGTCAEYYGNATGVEDACAQGGGTWSQTPCSGIGYCAVSTGPACVVTVTDEDTCNLISGTFTPGSAPSCDGLDCGLYGCEAGECLTSCTGGQDCADGAVCESGGGVGVCVDSPAPDPYLYVAVVSRAEGDSALNNANPGPDIDAVSFISGSTETFASAVVINGLGVEGDQANTRPDVSGVVNGLDTLGAAPEECDLEAEPGFAAIGGEGGFVVVTFGAGQEIVSGDTVVVYEINSANCVSAAVERPDVYEVYIATETIRSQGARDADAIRANWCLVGEQGGTGGTGEFTFDSSNCAGM
ncbi:MAG: hypothetical protein H6698_07350 [Myxococcales bacterium]|nr:hypothetical protein [Myxococcales bacterium]MCB9534122.1 hypothetical protein [Myxococcales bacterium]